MITKVLCRLAFQSTAGTPNGSLLACGRADSSIPRIVLLVCGVAMLCRAASPAKGDYQADFSTTGSAAHFAPFQINNTDDGDPSGTGDSTDFSVIGGANPYFQALASPPAGGSGGGALQVRYQVAPSLFAGAGVALPTGATNDVPRTEARLNVTIREILGGDDVPAENPFMQFGLTEFDPVAAVPDYATKVIIQLSNALNSIFLGYTTENPGGGTTTLGTFAYPGGSFTPGDVFEVRVTENQASLLLNSSPLLDGNGNSFFDLPAGFFTDFFDEGDELIPFFGVIRGPGLEDDDVMGAGFDDIDARNLTIDAIVFDISVIAANFLESVPVGTLGDGNFSGFVDFADFRIWKDASGFGGSLAEALALAGGGTVPEPGTGCLAALAASLVLWRVRRRTSG
jgi:hypothetical protein